MERCRHKINHSPIVVWTLANELTQFQRIGICMDYEIQFAIVVNRDRNIVLKPDHSVNEHGIYSGRHGASIVPAEYDPCRVVNLQGHLNRFGTDAFYAPGSHHASSSVTNRTYATDVRFGHS